MFYNMPSLKSEGYYRHKVFVYIYRFSKRIVLGCAKALKILSIFS